MSGELAINFGIIGCLLGTLFGGVFALAGGEHRRQRFSQVIMLIGLALGAVATGFFILKGEASLVILNSVLFPIGRLAIDQLAAIFFFLINVVSFLAVFYGVRYILNEKGHYNLGYVQFLTSLFIFGMQLVVLATTPVFFLFAWEIMSFASFLLVMADLRVTSIKPAIFYLIMTTLGAGAILAGFLFLSGGAVAMDFSSLAAMSKLAPTGIMVAAFLLFFFGFGSKAGLFPFHGWLPEAHPQAPSHISALMSGIMLKVAVYGLLRVLLFMLPVLPVELGYLVVAIGLFSAIFGVLYSIIETDIKRILAFSSIENLGLIFTTIGLFMVARSEQMAWLAEISLLAILFQVICHALFKSGLFLTAGVAGQVFHTRNIEKMGGLAKKMKVFSLAGLFLVLTAAALPPSGTFIGEWLVIQTVINNIAVAVFSVKVLLIIILICLGLVAGVAVMSMVRFFGLTFLAEARSIIKSENQKPSWEMVWPIVFLSLVAFLIGSVAGPVLENLSGNLIKPEMGWQLASSSEAIISFNPWVLLILILTAIGAVWFLRRLVSKVKNEREYHTWDCGQPINASMEYTATAFSAPIRFFFSLIIRANKKISTERVVESNSWLLKKSIALEVRPIWDQYFYVPVVQAVQLASASFRRLQNGNIQFYIALILVSLIITAIVSL